MTRWLILAILIDTALGQYFRISDTWEWYDQSILWSNALWVFVVVCLIPYRHLATKTIMAIFFLSELWEVAQFYAPHASDSVLLACNVAIFVPWLLYALFRSYTIPSARPKRGMLYRVTKRPHNVLGFILSLWGRATQGSGVWCNGKVYSYHKGKFKVVNRTPRNALVIATGKKSSAEIENKLNTKVGEMWTWRNNCVTLWWGLRRVH